MAAAIGLQEHAGLLFALPATAMTRRSPFPRAFQIGLTANAAHTGARDRQAMLFGQFFGEMAIVVVSILIFCQLQYLAANLRLDLVARGPAAIAVGHPWRTLLPVSSNQPADLSQGKSQEFSGLESGHLVVHDLLQKMQTF